MKKKILAFIVLGMAMLSVISAYSDSVYIEDYDLSIEYDSAFADEIFTLTISIVNDASSAKDLRFEFDSDEPFDFVTDKGWDLNLESGEMETKTFRIEVDKDAKKKTYDLEFNLDDGDDDWDDNFEIKVLSNSAEISLGEIISSPSKIYPGSDDVRLDISIRNKGEKNAEDLVAKIVLPEGFDPSSSYADIVYLGDLNAGEVKTLTYYFDVADVILEEEYNAIINLDYEVDGDEEDLSLDFDIPIFGIPQFEITNSEVLGKEIIPGSSTKVKLTVKNIGGEDAEDVSLKVYERSDQPFEFIEKSVYVGSLKIGETGYAVFEFDVDGEADPINYILDFQIRSLDGDSIIVDDLTTNINVVEKQFNLADYFVYALLGIFVLAGGILLFIFKRSKNGN